MGTPILPMKKCFYALITGTFITALCLVATGCKKETSNTALPTGTASAEKNSFADVAAKLDSGGNFYLYLSTEQFLDGLSTKVSGWRSFIGAMPNMSGDDRANVGKVFDVVTSLIKDSGIEDISGFGMSSFATEKGVYHSKSYLHHYPDKGAGFLWKLFGAKSHELAGLEMLPSTTALAMFSDADVSLGWSVIKNQVRHAGFPEAENFLNQLPAKFEQGTGLQWEKVIASLGGEFGVVVTLDDSKIIRLPGPGGDGMEVPEPGIVLVAKVKDNTIFDRVDKALTDALAQGGPTLERVDSSGLKMRTVQLPVPLPIQVRPSIATSDGYLFIALNGASIQEMLAVKSGKSPGLKSTEEFKHLSKNVPLEGNQFCYVSQRFGKTMIQLQKQAMQRMRGGGEAAFQQFFQAMLNPDDAGFAFSVSANTDEGWLTVGNGHQNPAVVLVAAPAVMVGVLAGIAIPNFVRARAAAQNNSCINNLRQIDGAKQMWALDKNKTSTDVPTQAELQPYVGRGTGGSWLQCPQGGHYTIGAVGVPPTCSIPGHTLN